MRTSIRTSILRVLSATALAIAVVGSTDPASAGMRAGGGGGFHGGGFGDFHGGGFGGRGFGGRGFAGRGFHRGFGFRDRRFAFGGFGGWGGYGCSPYWWSVNPYMCY
jgi:hypothetical protein